MAQNDAPEQWRIYITNDNCPDYTWGHTEEETRQAFADIVRSHLDEMKRTDDEPEENQDRYNMAVAQEALCFMERYPEREEELIAWIREGRVFVSPYLCNCLWAFQGVEGAIRTLYPARFAVQSFVDASVPGGRGITIAPLDAFLLRRDLPGLSFEALGNDQNYREVLKDQDGVTEFRFRYSLRLYDNGYGRPEAFAWSRGAAYRMLARWGRLIDTPENAPDIHVDPHRAIATCFKPADDGSGDRILRLWETTGESGPLPVYVGGFSRAVRTDLLERDQRELQIRNGEVSVELEGYGFVALRLVRD